jgi:hypothetical protein
VGSSGGVGEMPNTSLRFKWFSRWGLSSLVIGLDQPCVGQSLWILFEEF